MAAPSPVVVGEVGNLSTLGIQSDAIKFGELTIESDGFICIREKAGDKTALTTVELHNGNQVVRRPISAGTSLVLLLPAATYSVPPPVFLNPVYNSQNKM